MTEEITREEAIKTIEELIIPCAPNSKYGIVGRMAISALQDRPIGHWIETEYHHWRCSVCREKGMSDWDNIHDVRTNFCPNCGAKMESEDKE